MTLKECYAALNGDYEEAMGRLRSERLVQKFVLKFLEDGSFELLCRSMEAGDLSEAFRAAHTIKGVCANMAFSALLKSSSQLTELLRGGDMGDRAQELFQRVKVDYAKTAQAIQAFREEAGG